MGGQITLRQDLVSVLQAAIAEALKQQGFVPVTRVDDADGRQLRVEVRNLDYNVIVGFWTGTVRTECALKGICIVGASRPYEEFYRAVREETILFVQSDSANEEYINDVLSRALQELLSDSKLLQCLYQ